jgi:drug/metabolite transporter (DMT)-like permease
MACRSSWPQIRSALGHRWDPRTLRIVSCTAVRIIIGVRRRRYLPALVAPVAERSASLSARGRHPIVIGVSWMVASAAGYAFFTVFAQVALRSLRPVDVLFWRFVIAAPVAWLLVAFRSQLRSRPVAGGPALPSIGLGLLFGVLAWLAFAALEHLTGALYVVIIYTYPAMVAIGGRLLGRPAPARIAIPIVVMMIGIVLTAPEVFDGSRDGVLLGAAMTVGNAALYAGYILWSERLLHRGEGVAVDGLVVAAWGLTGSLVTAVTFSLCAGGPRLPDDGGTVAALVGLALVSTVLAGAGFLLGVRHIGAARAALLATLEPVLALVLLVTLRGERLGVLQGLGAALVLASVVWSQRLGPGRPGSPVAVGRRRR